MGLKVVYLDIATHDLKSIHKYISMDSKKYASLEVRKIKLFIDSLTQFPLKGKYFETQPGLKIFFNSFFEIISSFIQFQISR